MNLCVCVEDCFHWIGFHLVTAFLEEDWIVYGKDPLHSPDREHLSMFVGRHSDFSLLDDKEDKRMFPHIELMENQTGISLTKEEGKKVAIKCSSLIGEWMPMTDTHMLNGDKLQSWRGLDLKEIVEVGAYAEIVKQCLEAARIPEEIHIVSRFSKKAGDEDPGMIVVIDHKEGKEKLRSLKEHFSRFKPMYQEVTEC